MFNDPVLQKLISSLTLPENIDVIKKSRYFFLHTQREPSCVIFHDGIVALLRQKDSLLLSNICAPMIIGLSLLYDESLYPSFPLCFRAVTDIRCEYVPLSVVREVAETQSLWKYIALHQMKVTSLMTDYLTNMTGMSGTDIIEYCLERLMQEPEAIRSRRTASDYITEKTTLSRSTVMKALAALKKDGKIETYKGLLISKHPS
ncbi:helix-turn-helix domain-containing protein [Citrobacter sedlakii]|uniref:helix-turn-helix domain-containing protein n=1 Tax=Citrobacter sedlakii TaxID=67826 RepID=UPI001BAD8A4E|nr:helix-turn-helix domain-containing protein [Citrobacter sedlakii]EKJ8220849.1 helix-turn-helix domain-containing protein [Citrobacter sedlakii]QUC31202.1 helix-turn-helix domain-containing protein [Citrobacter sedlakii]HCT5822936.1 helix-turn-helix domain-containing protein [Citrobacter sedlakii]